jgi:hypothetical protein
LFSEGGAECDSSAFNNVDRRRTPYVPNSLELIYNGSLPAAGSSATVKQEDGQNTGCEFHFSGLKFHGKRPSSVLMSLKLIYDDEGIPEASAALGSLELKESGVVTRSGGSELEQEKSQNQSCGNLVDLPKNSRPQGCCKRSFLKLSKTAGRPINKGTSSESERLVEEGDVQNSSNDDMEPVVADPEVSVS